MKTFKHQLEIGYGLGVLAVALALMLLWPGLWKNLLVKSGFMPHGHCYLWKPALVGLHLTADMSIGTAYVAISATLAYLVYKSRRDIPFHWMFLLFGTFIVACGSTHFMEVWTLWTPTYWLAGELKLITAVASVTTALVLPPLVPQVLTLVEAAKISEERKLKLETANLELETLNQKLQELDQLKTQFFANVSHELRSPLTLILGPIEKLLATKGLSPSQHHDLEVVNRNARSLLDRVNDLLDVSKLEAGKMNVNYANVDLAKLVLLTASHFESLAQERQISFIVETPPSLPVQVDPEKIQRIYFNLLSNAFKFTPSGGKIHCTLQSEVESSSPTHPTRAILTVDDSGRGVAPELRSAIFEPFRQAEIGSTRSVGGTGLGLAIVKEFVELHGGSVAVSDSNAGGAKFTVELPLVAPEGLLVRTPTDESDILDIDRELARQVLAQNYIAQQKDVKEAPMLADRSEPLVLAIEDNPEMNHFIRETLASEYAVITAFNGTEGLEKAVQLRPDLILCDVMMPLLSGDRLVREVRSRQELNAIPIIMLTAKADDRLRLQMLREGVQDYLMKPFSVEELRTRVRNKIAMKRAREVLQASLASQNQDLTVLANELTARERELQQLTVELESRVAERTALLKAANESLKQEIAERQQVETELEREKEFLKVLLENLDAGIVACDANGVLTLFNRATREFHGLPLQSLPAREWAQYYDLYLPDGKTPMKKEEIPLFRALSGESVKNVEMTIAPKQGKVRTLLASGQAIINPRGEKVGAVVVMHDITDRKMAEEGLRLLKSVVVNANDAIVITEAEPVDKPGPKIIYVNDAFARMTGYTPAEVIGRTPRILQGPKTDRTALNKIRAALKQWQPIVVELINYRKDNSHFWVELSLVPVADETGWYTHWIAIERDITERKIAEAESAQLIREQEARAYAESMQRRSAFLAEASTILAASLDSETMLASLARQVVPYLADWCIAYTLKPNEAICSLAVAHPDAELEARLRQLECYYDPQLDSNCPRLVLEVLRTGRSAFYPEISANLIEEIADRHEHIELLKSLNPQSILIVPSLAGSQTLGAIVLAFGESGRRYTLDDLNLAEDLARRAALAIDKARLYWEAREANRIKDEFLAVLSHELRTPLNAILGWSQLMGTRKLNEETMSRALETIERNAKAQTQMIEDLLDVSRIVRGKLQLNMGAVNLVSVVEMALEAMKPTARAKAIELEFIFDSNLETISGDSDRLQQVVWNLLSNAIKFTPKEGRISVRLEGHKSNIQLQVSDSGIGINPSFLPYVFDRFRQADSSSTRSYGGLGLGLAIVRHLVELHGGTVRAESPGKEQGATFTVHLPLKASGMEIQDGLIVNT